MKRLKKMATESREGYIFRIYNNKIDLGLTNRECADIINLELGTSYQESYLRGIHKNYGIGYNECLEKGAFDSQLEEMKNTLREIKIERNKLNVERSENNQILRDFSRVDLRFEKVVQAIESLTPFAVKMPIERLEGDKEGVLVLTDIHYGKNTIVKGIEGEIINEYSEEIFARRMEELLSETIRISNKESIDKINLLLLGDDIEGILRQSALQQLKNGMIDQCMQFAEYLACWLDRLSDSKMIDVHYTLGNHSEARILNAKSGDFPQENLERIIMFYLKTRLKNNPNINIISNETGMVYCKIFDYVILGNHGKEKNLEQAVKDYADIYDIKINLFVTGHLHHNLVKEIGKSCEVMRVRSLCGIDEYSMELRKYSSAGSVFMVVEKDYGKTIVYDIRLK